MPFAVIDDGVPDFTEAGLAEQVTVGGSNAFTEYAAEQSAISPGAVPSET